MYTMLRRFYNWKFVAAFSISLLIIISIYAPKKHQAYKYAAVNTDYYDVPIPVEAEESAKTLVEIETHLSSIDKATAIITLTGRPSMVQLVTNTIRNMASQSSEEPEEMSEQIDDEMAPFDETILLPSTIEKLRKKLQCFDKSFESKVTQRGEFWVFINYIRAEHGPLACHEDITVTSHSDFTFLDNLNPLIESWNSPVSIAMHTPGDDLAPTLDSIRYVRDCSAAAVLVRKWVTFHIFFHKDHIPKEIPNIDELLTDPYNCSLPEPYSVNASTLYSANKSLLYPVNVGRNIARDAALTHFVFAVDIELYPSPHLGARFLNMIAREPPEIAGNNPRVFPVVLFEVEEDQQVPKNKTHLLAMLKTNKAIPFHKFVCPACHNVPKGAEWMSQNDTGQLNVFTVGKRTGSFRSWEPIFIGTHQQPMYEERLSWQGKSDKMTQSYIMCVQDYDYMMLNNAFLVHRPGIKHYKADSKRDVVVGQTNTLLHNTIAKELKTVYGTREGCSV